MSKPLGVFISSTVVDFAGVRDELGRHLRGRGYVVRTSETAEFPVAPNLHSHDACLAAIRECSVFILLVGERSGGEYRQQGKSITWREWEEACLHRLHTIVLVERSANSLLREVARARVALQKANPMWDSAQIDGDLRTKFPDANPRRQNLPMQSRFLDQLRRGQGRNNWAHLEWNGTPDEALRIIDSRCGSALAYLLSENRKTQAAVERESERLRSISSVNELLLAAEAAGSKAGDLHEFMLSICEERRAALFGFADDGLYNLMTYALVDGLLVKVARVCAEGIQRRNRSWPVGSGHVGITVRDNALLVSGDMRQTASWRTEYKSDEINYVSAVSIPLYFSGDTSLPDGVFIVTSDRLDHFVEPDSPDVVTIKMLASMLSRFGQPLEATAHVQTAKDDSRPPRIPGSEGSVSRRATPRKSPEKRRSRGRS